MNKALSLAASETGSRPDSSSPQVSCEPQTLWERAAESRWGKYLTEIEEQALLTAHHYFQAPGVGLEVGCEGGRWCRLLASLGWQMIGTDVNPETLRLCQERSPGVRCVLVDKHDESFPVDAQSIDLLLCMEVPVVEAPWFAGEAQRVLKPGGLLVGNLLNRSSWRGIATNVKSVLRGHPRYYNQRYAPLRASLRKHGFSLVHERGFGWAPFGRLSESPWIATAANWEHRLGLHRLVRISPWVAFVATSRQIVSAN